MKLAALCAMGIEELVDSALRGKLRPKHLWTAMVGATKYRKAVAAGDLATDLDQRLRVSICAGCEAIVWTNSNITGTRKGFCGIPFKESETTCGCLVALSIYGEGLQPAAKTVVASEACPRQRWGPVNRVESIHETPQAQAV